jgi:hypothetical protein
MTQYAQMPEPDPVMVGKMLARSPRKLPVVHTTDGDEFELQDDGGKVSGRTGRMEAPGIRRQQAQTALLKKRKDPGFEGVPAIVAREVILPAFKGDILTTEGGIIKLLGRDVKPELIEKSREVRNKRLLVAATAGAKAVAEVATTEADKALAANLAKGALAKEPEAPKAAKKTTTKKAEG